MSIFDKLASKKNAERQTAHERYVRLLAKIDNANVSEQDAAELEALMTELGIGHERAADDHNRIHDALADHLIAARCDDLRRSIEPAAEAFLKACEKRQAVFHEQNAIVQAARQAEEVARDEHDVAQKARGRVDQFGQADPATSAIVVDVFNGNIKPKKK